MGYWWFSSFIVVPLFNSALLSYWRYNNSNIVWCWLFFQATDCSNWCMYLHVFVYQTEQKKISWSDVHLTTMNKLFIIVMKFLSFLQAKKFQARTLLIIGKNFIDFISKWILSNFCSSGSRSPVYSMSYNPAENAILLCTVSEPNLYTVFSVFICFLCFCCLNDAFFTF